MVKVVVGGGSTGSNVTSHVQPDAIVGSADDDLRPGTYDDNRISQEKRFNEIIDDATEYANRHSLHAIYLAVCLTLKHTCLLTCLLAYLLVPP